MSEQSTAAAKVPEIIKEGWLLKRGNACLLFFTKHAIYYIQTKLSI